MFPDVVQLSGFFKFSMAKREEVKMQNPDIGVSVSSRRCTCTRIRRSCCRHRCRNCRHRSRRWYFVRRGHVVVSTVGLLLQGCAKILGQMWRDLNDEERASYTTKETEEEEDPQGGELDEVVDEITEEVAGGVKGMDGVDGPDRPDTDEMVAGADNMAEDGPPVE